MTSIEPLPCAADLATSTGKSLEQAAFWLARLAEVVNHFATHDRFPRARRGGKAESRLYEWLAGQRRKPGPEPFRSILDAWLPGWSKLRREFRGTFEARVQELKVYRDAYGTWPTWRSNDEGVSLLAKWLAGQRQLQRAGEMASARKALLDEQVPGWDETVQQTWERTAREIAVFRDRLGRMPSSVAAEHSERRLARWIDDMRRGRGLSPERKTFLDEVLPGWYITRRTSGLKQYAGATAIQ
jgi:hypothetical protein